MRKVTLRPSLGAIFLTVFLDLLGFGLVMPFLAEEARDTFHTTAFVGTLLGSVYSLMQFLFVPVWGRLSDRIGRRPVLVWSIAATTLSMTALGLALTYGHSVIGLFAARIFSGIATANLGTASAYIADVTAPKDRAKGMGLIGMAFGLGFILGPAVGGMLAQYEIHGRHGPLACFVAAGLSLANLVWVIYGLAESLSVENRAQTQKRDLAPLNHHAARETFRRPGLANVILVNFLILIGFTNLDQTFRYFTKDIFAMTATQTGLLLAGIGIVAAGVQGGVIRPLAKRFSDVSLIRAGVLVQFAAFTGFVISPQFGRAALLGAGALLALGNGLTQPTIPAFISNRTPANAQGGTLGTNQSIASLARMFGPALGGYFYGALGPTIPYVAGACGMGLAFLASLALENQHPDVIDGVRPDRGREASKNVDEREHHPEDCAKRERR